MTRPFSQACQNNQAPILAILQTAFAECKAVFEIGSGTGQHAVHFSSALSQINWQTSDLPDNHAGINAWIDSAPVPNLLRPVVFNLAAPVWPGDYDAVYSANTLHIVSWPAVQTLFFETGKHLPTGGVLAIYGPFNYGGTYTSDSNRAFDEMLRARDPASGIRDFETVTELAIQAGLQLTDDHPMPANNRTLLFTKN